MINDHVVKRMRNLRGMLDPYAPEEPPIRTALGGGGGGGAGYRGHPWDIKANPGPEGPSMDEAFARGPMEQPQEPEHPIKRILRFLGGHADDIGTGLGTIDPRAEGFEGVVGSAAESFNAIRGGQRARAAEAEESGLRKERSAAYKAQAEADRVRAIAALLKENEAPTPPEIGLGTSDWDTYMDRWKATHPEKPVKEDDNEIGLGTGDWNTYKGRYRELHPIKGEGDGSEDPDDPENLKDKINVTGHQIDDARAEIAQLQGETLPELNTERREVITPSDSLALSADSGIVRRNKERLGSVGEKLRGMTSVYDSLAAVLRGDESARAGPAEQHAGPNRGRIYRGNVPPPSGGSGGGRQPPIPAPVQKRKVTQDQKDYLVAQGKWDASKYEVAGP